MYDTLIIGLGCAGYTAAIYSARYKLSTFLVGKEEGGMGMSAAEVGNWPGDIEVNGADLMLRMKAHAESFEEVTSVVATIEKIEKTDDGFQITMTNGETAEGKTLIMATGSRKRHMGIPGEEEFSGRGVTYCATCDAFFYKGKSVAVIGGGDSAVEGAAIAAQVANRVYLIHRRDTFKAEPFWVEKVREKNNVVFITKTNVTEILGDQKVTGIKLDVPHDGKEEITLDGVFIEVGSIPETTLAQEMGCEVDDHGFLKVNTDMSTNIPGVYGAGDVTNGSNHFAQFATSVGEGALASNSVFNFLQNT